MLLMELFAIKCNYFQHLDFLRFDIKNTISPIWCFRCFILYIITTSVLNMLCIRGILLVFLFYMPFVILQHYDDDCEIEDYKVIKNTKAELAFVVDVSKNMEPYRFMFQENFSAMLTPLQEIHSRILGTYGFGTNIGYLTNGCHAPDLKYIQHVNVEWDFEELANLLKAVPTKENAKSGVENAIAGIDAAWRYYWSDRMQCHRKLGSCPYQYIVLITGSSSSYNISDCRGKPIPSLKRMKQGLHKKDHAFRIIGFFPTQALVQEYAQMAKNLDVPYFGFSFEENPQNVLKMPEFLLECLRVDIRSNWEAYGRPCQWEDPIGYNTLGL